MKKTQLFLLHFAGGNRYSFQFMKPFLKDFDVVSLELPGRGKRSNEHLLRDFHLAIQDIYEQILKHRNGSEFMIYGHSMGAHLGLGVTHLLENAGEFPICLFVSGNHGPERNTDKKRYLLNDDDFMEELIQLEGMPLEILEDRTFLEYYLPIVKADFEVTEKQVNDTFVVHTPIIAMMGNKEENATKIVNWQKFTTAMFKFEFFEGGHFFIYKHPQRIVDMITAAHTALMKHQQ